MGQSVKQETKERIVEAGKRVIFEKGFNRARVSDITSSAGLAHGTFYLYFKTKEEFLLYLLEEVKGEMLNLVQKGIDLIRSGEVEEGKRLVFLETFSLMTSQRELAKILFFEAICSSSEFQSFYRDTKLMFLEKLREVFDLIGVDRAEVKAHAVSGMARHLVELLILTGQEVEETWVEFLRDIGLDF